MDLEPPSFLISFFAENSFFIFSSITLLVLLVLSGLVSASEVALFSLSQTEINAERESDTPNGLLLAELLEQPKKLLATILIANNLINISIVLVFAPLGEILFNGLSVWQRAVLDIGVVTFFILLFGEILPKIYANRNNVSFSRMIVKPIQILSGILYPLSSVMIFVTSFINNRLGKQKTNISVSELSQALELTSEGDTTKEEQKILEGIVSFGNTETRQVMRPRMDICAVNEQSSFKEMLSIIVENGYSRVPIFKENIDTITGVIYAKDLLPYLDRTNFEWQKIKRKAFFVPENKKLDDLLAEFQSKKIHLAVVVDEYGGTSGIVTLEDIIEEIVGEISDEYDVDDSFFTQIDANTFLFEGKTPMKDFYRILNLSEKEETLFENSRGEAETLAGFLLEIAGIFPEKKQIFNFLSYSFSVENIDKKRITQIKITRNE